MHADSTTELLRVVRSASESSPETIWCAHISDARTGKVLFDLRSDAVFPAASAPKVLLLIAAAQQILSGDLDPAGPIDRTAEDHVGDSGLWQHLAIDAMPAADLCALIGSVSDNLATNALLRHLGIPAVNAVAVDLGLSATRILDQVRSDRVEGDHPRWFSVATVAELAQIVSELHRPKRLVLAVAELVVSWLSTGVDLSLVASGFGLDPLVHHADLGAMWNKTGSDPGIRIDTGVLVAPRSDTMDVSGVIYAVGALWSAEPWPDRALDEVTQHMGDIGVAIRNLVTQSR